MTIRVVGADEIAQVIEQTVKLTVAEVVRQMKEGERYEPQDIMNTGELLEYLHRHGVRLSRATIFDKTHRGLIPHFKAGNQLRFNRQEIDLWLEEYCDKGRTSHKADKSVAVEALANSAAEIAKRNK